MDVENQKIKVRINNFNEDHFRSLGYKFERNDYVEIPVKHLPIGSGLKIDVQCLYCGIIFKKQYRRYLETKNDVSCEKCKYIKVERTSLERYGNKCSLRNDDVLQKSKDKNLENIRVEFPFQSKKILKKCMESTYKIYGRHSMSNTISKPQKYIHNIYGGIINKSVFPYRLDIFFEDEKIYFEYDGSGHRMGVMRGYLTEEEFTKKQYKRMMFLKDLGYKEFRIICEDDNLPTEEELINIKIRAFYILLNEEYNHYYYNLSTKTESFEK